MNRSNIQVFLKSQYSGVHSRMLWEELVAPFLSDVPLCQVVKEETTNGYLNYLVFSSSNAQFSPVCVLITAHPTDIISKFHTIAMMYF